jgi:hypothetical protein
MEERPVKRLKKTIRTEIPNMSYAIYAEPDDEPEFIEEMIDVAEEDVLDTILNIVFPEFDVHNHPEHKEFSFRPQWMKNIEPRFRDLESLREIPPEHNALKILLLFVQQHLYGIGNEQVGQQRIFSVEKAIYLLRWIGPKCWKFIYESVVNEQIMLHYPECIDRWRFLLNNWDVQNLYFNMSLRLSQNAISRNHSMYFIRLSNTQPGMVTVDYWNSKKNTVTSTRWRIDSEELKNGIRHFDRVFREWYFENFDIVLPSVFDKRQGASYVKLIELDEGYTQAY